MYKLRSHQVSACINIQEGEVDVISSLGGKMDVTYETFHMRIF
jgi:hypothetical protein